MRRGTFCAPLLNIQSIAAAMRWPRFVSGICCRYEQPCEYSPSHNFSQPALESVPVVCEVNNANSSKTYSLYGVQPQAHSVFCDAIAGLMLINRRISDGDICTWTPAQHRGGYEALRL